MIREKSPQIGNIKSIISLEQKLASYPHIREIILPSEESKAIFMLAEKLKEKKILLDERLRDYLSAPLIIDDFDARYDEGRNKFEDEMRQTNPEVFEFYKNNRLRNNTMNNVLLYIQKLEHEGTLDEEDRELLKEFSDEYLKHTNMKLNLEERKTMVRKLDALVQSISKRYLFKKQESVRSAA